MDEASLLAGLGIRDLTPEPGIPLWGYIDRSGPATGVRDKLYARCLVLEAGGARVALIALDLGRVPCEAMMRRIRRHGAEHGVAYIFCSATHTHHGPAMEWEEGPHIAVIEEAIYDALDAALHELVPVTMHHFSASLDIGHNRREIRDGRCLMRWRNEAKVATSPIDREATGILLRKTDGQALVLLVHHACHPVIMGPDNLEYSADWPGAMIRHIREETGIESLFLQGACGDINPCLDKTPLEQGGGEAMTAAGVAAAAAILESLPGARLLAGEGALAWKSVSVEVGLRWNLEDPEQRKLFVAFYGELYEEYYLKPLRPDLSLTVEVLVINGALALVGVPGEPFTHHQWALKATGGATVNLLCGYVNGYHAYLPPVRDALAGGYGGTVGSYVGIGAMDKMLTAAQTTVAELLGATGRTAVAEDFSLPEL